MKHADRLRQIQASKARLSRVSGIRSETATAGEQSTAELWLYGVVGGFWLGFNAESVAAQLRGIDTDTITVRLHSPGGNALDGIAISNLLRNHKATITVVVDGLAASAASVVALGADRVVMSPGSQMMIHDASVLTYGNAAELREDADWIDKQSQNYAGIYAARAGGTAEQWRERMVAETWYSADEAVDAGLADEVGTVPAAGSPPVEPDVNEDDLDDELAARMAFDLDVLVHPAARAAWRPTKPPTASAGGSITTQEGSPAVAFSDEQVTTMRQKLGLPENADEATILAALDEALDERSEPTATATIPEGSVLVEETVLTELREGAQAGREAREALQAQERDRVIDAAIRAGKTTPARRDHWAAAYKADPEGTRAMLDALEPGLVPTSETGHDNPVAENKTEDDAVYAAVFGDEKGA